MDMAALGRNLTILFFLTLLMIYVNGALSSYDTNFMYVVRPPMEKLPYLNLEKGWYVYFLHLLALGLTLLCLFYAPFLLYRQKNAKKAPARPVQRN